MSKLISLIQRPHWRLHWKLLVGFLAANFLLGLALAVALVNLSNTRSALSTFKVSQVRSQLLTEIDLTQNRLVTSALDYSWTDNLIRLNDYNIARLKLQQTISSFQPNPSQQERYVLLKQQADSLINVLNQVIELGSSDQTSAAQQLWRTQGSRQAGQLQSLTGDLSSQELNQAEAKYKEVISQVEVATWESVGLAVMALLAAVALALIFTVAVTRPIEELRRRLADLANGDLTRPVEIINRDELGELALTYNTTLAALQELVRELHLEGQQVSSATEELTSQARHQVIGSNEQASAITEASVSLRELTNTAEEIAKQTLIVAKAADYSFGRAEAVSLLTEEIANALERGRSTVGRTIETVFTLKEQISSIEEQQQELVTRSNQIQGIIKWIEELAKEIHLLALNASIEAAGAGLYGARFAIIAQEVKELAERSGSATKEVRAILEGIPLTVKEVANRTEKGLDQAEQAVAEAILSNKVLEELAGLGLQIKAAAHDIVKEVKNTAALSSSIGAATQQQQVASSHLLERMVAIETITTQTLTNIRQGEEVSRQLNHSAQKLKRSASTFKLENAPFYLSPNPILTLAS